VGEAVLSRSGFVLHQNPVAHGPLEVVDQGNVAQNVRQRPGVDGIVEERRNPEGRATVGSEPVEAARNDLVHPVRHAPRSPRRSRVLLGRQGTDDLAEEERVAVRLAVEHVAEHAGGAACLRQCEPARAVRGGEAAQEDPAGGRLAREP